MKGLKGRNRTRAQEWYSNGDLQRIDSLPSLCSRGRRV